MRLIGLLLVGGLLALVATSTALGSDMMSAATTELGTALTHAGFAAQYNGVAEVELHLHHVVNCLEGSSGMHFNQQAGNVCQGQGNGILADLKDSGMAGAHAMPFAEIADQVANWGIQQTMAKDVGRAKAAAAATKAIIQLAIDNFK